MRRIISYKVGGRLGSGCSTAVIGLLYTDINQEEDAVALLYECVCTQGATSVALTGRQQLKESSPPLINDPDEPEGWL